MNILPLRTSLGALTLDIVIEYYDFPRLFVCHSNLGHHYIALSIYDDEYEFHWLYLAISTSRLVEIADGKLPLFVAYAKPETGFLTKIITYLDDKQSFEKHLTPDEIPTEDFPESDYTLLFDSGFLYDKSRRSAKDTATATRRETLEYRIFPNRGNIHDISAKNLGNILTATQELTDALGQAICSQPTNRGSIQADIIQKTKLQVTQSFYGSFGIQFCSNEISDLFDDSIISKALEELASLICAKDSQQLLSERLHRLQSRVASRYRLLLKELSDANSGLYFEWGSVNPNNGGIFELSLEQIRKAYELVDNIETEMSETILIDVKLIGFNSRIKQYEIQSTDNNTRYCGKVANDAKLTPSNPVIGDLYKAKLRKIIQIQPTSGHESTRWVLLELNPSH